MVRLGAVPLRCGPPRPATLVPLRGRLDVNITKQSIIAQVGRMGWEEDMVGKTIINEFLVLLRKFCDNVFDEWAVVA